MRLSERDISGLRSQAISAFLFLAIIAVLGVILRYLFFGNIPGINFKFLLHAHSHAALLGWVHAAVCGLVIWFMLSGRSGKSYKIQFWGMQACVAGMLFSFPFQGYGPVSISFSTAHILLSYWFAFAFFRDTRREARYSLPLRFVRTALVFMLLGTAGPIALAPIMVLDLHQDLYYSAIYFYLHFMYNGWFTMALFGLLFSMLEKFGIAFDNKKTKGFYYLVTVACIPAYSLSALWLQPPAIVYSVGFISAAMQLIGFILLYRVLLAAWPELRKKLTSSARFLLVFTLVVLAVKFSLQLVSAFPYMADLAYKVRNFIIGYLHLVLLGFVTAFLFALLIIYKILPESRHTRTGLILFFTGFLLSELLIFGDSTLIWLRAESIPSSHQLLFGVSLLMPVGAILLLASFFSKKEIPAKNQFHS